jgi:CheY-like chemotaxis protein
LDDEAMLRHLLARTLGEAGFDLIEAENGDAALRAIRGSRDSLRLVVTDLSMPVMSGVEFAREFRPLYPRAAHPVHHRPGDRYPDRRRVVGG